MKTKAICLYSGGLDSTTCLYLAQKQGYTPIALTLHYGQTHHREIEMTRKVCQILGIEQYQTQWELPWKGSALLDSKISLPKKRSLKEMTADIPSTYVPARNSIFLSMAASCAEAQQAQTIFIGVNALDYSGYPDCRPEYIKAFENLLKIGTKEGVEGRPLKIETPLLYKTKKEIVKLAVSLQVPLEWTWSCYEGGQKPCQECDSCLLRAKGFEEAGLHDPLLIRAQRV